MVTGPVKDVRLIPGFKELKLNEGKIRCVCGRGEEIAFYKSEKFEFKLDICNNLDIF